MVSLIERSQSVLAGVVLALLVASIVLVPQNRALGMRGAVQEAGSSVVAIHATMDAVAVYPTIPTLDATHHLKSQQTSANA